MSASWVLDAAGQGVSNGLPMVGVAVAEVITNLDPLNQGRVQLRLPWLPGVEPWARVAAPGAGSGRGFYFLPQPDEEVLVAFHNGDVREPYILGSLWNASDRPPAKSPLDPVQKRILHTPLGHRLEFDDATNTVTLETPTGQKVTMAPDQIEARTAKDGASVVLQTAGTVKITAKVKIELEAPTITLKGVTVEVKGSAGVKVNGGATCEIQAALVKIN